MKLAIAGEGGAAKATIAGTPARHPARDYEVLALDNYLNPNLSLTVGIEAERLTDLPAMGADVARVVDGRLELTQTLDEIREAHAMTAPDGVTVLVAGEPKEAGYGRMGRRHLAVRTVVSCSRWPAISASPTALLASKIREGELPSVQASPTSGFELADAVSWDECFHHAERAAVAPIDFSPDSPAVVAIGRLAGRLIRGGRAA